MKLYEVKVSDSFKSGRFYFEKQIMLRICKLIGAKFFLETPSGSQEISINSIDPNFKYRATAFYLYVEDEKHLQSSEFLDLIKRLEKFKSFTQRFFVVSATEGEQPLMFYRLNNGKLSRHSFMYQVETSEDVKSYWNTSLHIYHTHGPVNSGREYFEENVFSNLHYKLGSRLQMVDFDKIEFEDGFIFESGDRYSFYVEIAWID